MIYEPLRGTDFFYSDCDSETLAEVVTVMSGQPVEQFLQQRLFEPLGMTNTCCVIDKDTPRTRFCASYLGQPGFWQKFWSNQDAPFFPYFLGSQSAYSSTFDYARFLALWLDRGQAGGKRLLPERQDRSALLVLEVPTIWPEALIPEAPAPDEPGGSIVA